MVRFILTWSDAWFWLGFGIVGSISVGSFALCWYGLFCGLDESSFRFFVVKEQWDFLMQTKKAVLCT